MLAFLSNNFPRYLLLLPTPIPLLSLSLSLSPTSTLAVVGTQRTEPVARRDKPDGGCPFPRCEAPDHVACLPFLFPSSLRVALPPFSVSLFLSVPLFFSSLPVSLHSSSSFSLFLLPFSSYLPLYFFSSPSSLHRFFFLCILRLPFLFLFHLLRLWFFSFSLPAYFLLLCQLTPDATICHLLYIDSHPSTIGYFLVFSSLFSSLRISLALLN